MIDFIEGTIIKKAPTLAIIQVGGIGIALHVPISTYEAIGEPGEEVSLCTYLSIKNEELNLYGFASNEERELFQKLVSVQGIGAKSALGILSEIRVNEFERAVLEEDTATLTAIHGIGPKTAKRILFELKESIRESRRPAAQISPLKRDAVSALVSLGFKASKARTLVEQALKGKESHTVEELIKETLKLSHQ
jgi:Holliday junction DNA helicase RuvA